MRHIIIVAIICLAGACAGPRPNLSIEKAQAAFTQAQSDPDATKYAPQAIEKAHLYLQKALSGWPEGYNQSNVYFYAELSRRYSESAIAQGREAAVQPVQVQILPQSAP